TAWPVAQTLPALPVFEVALNDRLVSAVPLCLAILAAFAIDTGWWRWAPIVLIVLIALAAFRLPFDRLRLVAELAPLAIIVFVRRPQLVLALIFGQRLLAHGALIPTHPPQIAY